MYCECIVKPQRACAGGLLTARASEQGNVIGLVSVYNFFCNLAN